MGVMTSRTDGRPRGQSILKWTAIVCLIFGIVFALRGAGAF